MRIFKSFLIVLGAVVLLILPYTTAVYDFRTDLKTNTFTELTAVATTTANVTLTHSLYDDDTSTISITSNLTSDSPTFSSFDTTTRDLKVAGLSANSTRLLTVTYDVSALEDSDAIDTLLDRVAWIILLIAVAFPVAGIAAVWFGRA